jgi:hypothetical protein
VVKSQVVGGEPWDPIYARDIWIVNADESGRARQLTARGSSWDPYRLSWSPDGRTVGVRVATGVVTNLTDPAAITESSPIWSPDGRWLPYGRRSTETGATPQVWLTRFGSANDGRRWADHDPNIDARCAECADHILRRAADASRPPLHRGTRQRGSGETLRPPATPRLLRIGADAAKPVPRSGSFHLVKRWAARDSNPEPMD